MLFCFRTVDIFAISETSLQKETVEFQGIILDAKTGEGIPGAAIKLDDGCLWAITDIKGHFSIEKIEPSSYTLEISCLGYVTYSKSIILKRDIHDFKLKLHENSLALDAVVVTAQKSKDNINTTHSIGRDALNHLQLANMSDISALLPGGKTINSDLTKENVMSLRTGGLSVGNASFGTVVEVDGVRMGGNANFNKMSGIGTRSLQVGNIQSVEVITGVPSAEYGDLNSGVVKVITKKGRTPLDIIFSVNPRTYDVSVSKGLDLGNKKGILNVSGELTKATAKLSSPYTSYIRRGFTIDYSNNLLQNLRLVAGLSGNIGGMNSKNDPDVITDEYSRQRDNMLTPHFKLVWLLNKKWITNLSIKGSIYYHDRKSREHRYYSSASSQPAVHAPNKGYYAATMLPLTYYSDKMNDSKELDYAASLKYTWLKHLGNAKSLFKAGVQWKANGNIGNGEYYLDPTLAENGYRPRPYSDYPYMHNLSFYAEDLFTFKAGRTRIQLCPGIRFENVFIDGSDYDKTRTLSPRFNAKWFLSRKVAIRGGWGVTEKLPGFYILFPRQEYRDIMTAGFSHKGNEGSASYIYYTEPYKMQYNPGLKWQKNINSELGIDFELLKTKISLVGYYNKTKNPYEYTNAYEPFSYNVMKMPEDFVLPENLSIKIDHQTGELFFRGNDDEFYQPSVLKVKDESFANSMMQSNGCTIRRAGVELTMDFPEIKPIKTSLRLDAVYTHAKFINDQLTPYYRQGYSHTFLPNRSYQYLGIYAGRDVVYNGKRVNNIDANLTSITHIPQARLVITCRLEMSLLKRSRRLSEHNGKQYAYNVSERANKPAGGSIYDGNSYTAIRPVKYMDLEGNIHDFTDREASDPDFANLILKSSNAFVFAQDGYEPYMSANLSVTKEIGDHVSFSFFANNFTNARKFVKSKATGMKVVFTPKFYYGLTCRIKL